MCRRALVSLAFLGCSALSFAQWNAAKIEAFAGEFRLTAQSLPQHKAGQMMGALAKLGIVDAKRTLEAVDGVLDPMLAKPADLQAAVKSKPEMVSLVNLAFNAYATMGDYPKATKMLAALDRTMWVLGAETAFLDAPYASQKALLPLVLTSIDRASMLAAMMKGAALAGNFPQINVHADELIALTKEKQVNVNQAMLDRFLDLKFYGKAVELLAVAPRSDDLPSKMAEVGAQAWRGGDFQALDKIEILLAESLKGKELPYSAELVFIQTLRSREPEKVIQDVAKLVQPHDYRFYTMLQRHAEALMLRAKFPAVQALLATYPKRQEATIRGVLVAQKRVEDRKTADNIKLLKRNLMTLEFLIEEGFTDEAATLYDEIGKDLQARSQFYCARNIAKDFLDAGKVERAVVYLKKAKERLLTPAPDFTIMDMMYSDVAGLYGQVGDLATLKELLAKRKVNDYPKPAEALVESFMSSFRAGLIRK